MHRHQRVTSRSLAALGIALTLAACTTDAATDTPTSAAAEASVTVEGFAFAPASIEVTPGTTVTWTNADDFAHTVTSGAPNAPDGVFDEPLGDATSHQAAGSTASVTFDEPGTYAYVCDLHPSMVGEVVVTTP